MVLEQLARTTGWESSFSTNGFLDGVLDNFMVFNRGVTDQEAFSRPKVLHPSIPAHPEYCPRAHRQ